MATIPFREVDVITQRGQWHGLDHHDCTVRALANATGWSYAKCHKLAELAGRKSRQGFNMGMLLLDAKLEAGLRVMSPLYARTLTAPRQSADYYRYASRVHLPTLAQVMPLLTAGRFVLTTRDHAFAVVDGVVLDDGLAAHPRYRIETIYEVRL